MRWECFKMEKYKSLKSYILIIGLITCSVCSFKSNAASGEVPYVDKTEEEMEEIHPMGCIPDEYEIHDPVIKTNKKNTKGLQKCLLEILK